MGLADEGVREAAGMSRRWGLRAVLSIALLPVTIVVSFILGGTLIFVTDVVTVQPDNVVLATWQQPADIMYCKTPPPCPPYRLAVVEEGCPG